MSYKGKRVLCRGLPIGFVVAASVVLLWWKRLKSLLRTPRNLAGRMLAVALLSIVVGLALWPQTVSAQEPVDCIYLGTVKLDGENIPDEMVVSAWIGDLHWVAQDGAKGANPGTA